MSEQPAPPPESPGRYRRTYGGLIASLLVTVLVVVAYVGVRALNRDQPDIDPEPVDYLAAVQAAQQAGVTLVYPRGLPAGWTATSVTFNPGEPIPWGIGILTDDGQFVGLRQEDADVDDLLDTHVDEDAAEGDAVTIDSAVATSWQTWSDEGGDLAYSSAFGEQTLLVYGSASEADQITLIGLLSTEPLDP